MGANEMKKLFFLILINIIYITPVWADRWTLVTTSEVDTKIYVDKSSIRSEGNKVFWLQLDSYAKKMDVENETIFSSVGKIEGDCLKMARRDLYVSYHEKKMGKGKIVFEDTETSEWVYNRLGSVWYITLNYVCKKK